MSVAFVPVNVYTVKFGKKITLENFSKKSYSAFFSILKRCSLFKMHDHPQFSFSISIALGMIYPSQPHLVIIWEKNTSQQWASSSTGWQKGFPWCVPNKQRDVNKPTGSRSLSWMVKVRMILHPTVPTKNNHILFSSPSLSTMIW